ncbi:MAG: hypothetical protein WD013_03980 [Gemmatimonadota bacterium]
MTSESPDGDTPLLPEHARAYSQLLRQQERALQLLNQIATELGAPVTDALVEQLHRATSSGVARQIDAVSARIKEAIRTAQECRSAIHGALVDSRGDPAPNGPANLPPALARFLAERKDSPGFTFNVDQDPVRGWIIRWKEYCSDGSVCGGGQFYERPYAWMDS